MTDKKLQERRARFMPDGVPKWIRCYDNDGETCDRYTVVYTGRYRHSTGGVFWFVNMSGAPFHPQGVGMHGEHHRQIDTNDSGFAPAIGRRCHLGKRVRFDQLPTDCQALVRRDYEYLWDLSREPHPCAVDPFAA